MAKLSMVKKIFLGLAFVSTAYGTSWAEAPPDKPRPPLAELWVQTSAEYQGLCYQAYGAASSQFEQWAPLLTKREDGKAYLPGSNKPVAIILDLDETVINNSGFQAFGVKTNTGYNPAIWDAWVEFQGINEAAGPAIPGAVEFLAKAEAMGVTPIFISNRQVGQEPPTIKCLERAGINVKDIENRLLLKQEGKKAEEQALKILKEQRVSPSSPSGRQVTEGEGEKEARRRIIEGRYDVLAYFGDVYGDFEPFLSLAESTLKVFEQRKVSATQNRANWGKIWYILPNPMYGSWGPGAAIPKTEIKSSLNDYGFETYVRGRRLIE